MTQILLIGCNEESSELSIVLWDISLELSLLPHAENCRLLQLCANGAAVMYLEKKNYDEHATENVPGISIESGVVILEDVVRQPPVTFLHRLVANYSIDVKFAEELAASWPAVVNDCLEFGGNFNKSIRSFVVHTNSKKVKNFKEIIVSSADDLLGRNGEKVKNVKDVIISSADDLLSRNGENHRRKFGEAVSLMDLVVVHYAFVKLPERFHAIDVVQKLTGNGNYWPPIFPTGGCSLKYGLTHNFPKEFVSLYAFATNGRGNPSVMVKSFSLLLKRFPQTAIDYLKACQFQDPPAEINWTTNKRATIDDESINGMLVMGNSDKLTHGLWNYEQGLFSHTFEVVMAALTREDQTNIHKINSRANPMIGNDNQTSMPTDVPMQAHYFNFSQIADKFEKFVFSFGLFFWCFEKKKRPNTEGGKLFAQLAEQRVPATLWGEPGLRAVLSHKWHNFGFRYYILETIVLMVYLILFSVTTYTPNIPVNFSSNSNLSAFDWFRSVSALVLILLSARYLYITLRKFFKYGFWSFVTSIYNWLDVFGVLLVIATLPLNVYGYEEMYLVASVAVLVIWLRLLTYTRGYYKTGVFVRTLIKILSSIRYFLLILGIVLLAFSHSFYLLNQTTDHFPYYQQFGVALFTQYTMMYNIVNFSYGSPPLENPDSVVVLWCVLYVLFSVLVTLTMLNMLIALMSSTYSAVVEHAEFEWLQEMAQILAEIQTLGMYWFDEHNGNFPPVIHYLIPSDALKNFLLENERGEVQDELDNLKDHLSV